MSDIQLYVSISHTQKLGIELHKYDEMESLIQGVRYFSQNCPEDCYYWTNPMKPEVASKVIFPFDPDSNPYIIVNIGSGVSVLHVLSPRELKRIGGEINEFMDG